MEKGWQKHHDIYHFVQNEQNKIFKCVIFQFAVLWQSPDLMSHKFCSFLKSSNNLTELKKKISSGNEALFVALMKKSFWWRSPEIVVPEIQSDLGSKSQKIEMFGIEKKKCLGDSSVAIQPVI